MKVDQNRFFKSIFKPNKSTKKKKKIKLKQSSNQNKSQNLKHVLKKIKVPQKTNLHKQASFEKPFFFKKPLNGTLKQTERK